MGVPYNVANDTGLGYDCNNQDRLGSRRPPERCPNSDPPGFAGKPGAIEAGPTLLRVIETDPAAVMRALGPRRVRHAESVP